MGNFHNWGISVLEIQNNKIFKGMCSIRRWTGVFFIYINVKQKFYLIKCGSFCEIKKPVRLNLFRMLCCNEMDMRTFEIDNNVIDGS